MVPILICYTKWNSFLKADSSATYCFLYLRIRQPKVLFSDSWSNEELIKASNYIQTHLNKVYNWIQRRKIKQKTIKMRANQHRPPKGTTYTSSARSSRRYFWRLMFPSDIWLWYVFFFARRLCAVTISQN